MNITTREKHVLIIFTLTLPILAFFNQQIINEHEIELLLFYLAPLGFYIATDPQRRIIK